MNTNVPERTALSLLARVQSDGWGLLTAGDVLDADALQGWIDALEAELGGSPTSAAAALCGELGWGAMTLRNRLRRRRLDRAQTLSHTALCLVGALRSAVGLGPWEPSMDGDGDRSRIARSRWVVLVLFSGNAVHAAHAAGYNESYFRIAWYRDRAPAAEALRGLCASPEGRAAGLSAGWVLSGEGPALAAEPRWLEPQETHFPAE